MYGRTLILATLVGAFAIAEPAGATGAGTQLVDVSTASVQANAAPGTPIAVSSSGRYVAFWSSADNLVPGDGNGASDVFVRDTVAGSTERVSVSSAGIQGNDASFGPVAISADGRYVVFQTLATNLAANTGGTAGDLVIRDRTSATTKLVVSFFGLLVGHPVGNAAVSDNGVFVAYDAFSTSQSNLVQRKSLLTGVVKTVNPLHQTEPVETLAGISADGSRVLLTVARGGVWMHDFPASIDRRVDVNNHGVAANRGSHGNALSGDGRFAMFTSSATNLIPNDTNGHADVFVRGLQSFRTSRISISTVEAQGNGGASGLGISGNGRYRLFLSGSTNLVSADSNVASDVFIRDALAGTTRRCSVADDGSQANSGSTAGGLSRTGLWAAFISAADNLVAADANGLADVFLRGPAC
jgi:hypothetical protein